MLNRLSPKDIKFLSVLAKTPEDKSALDEYIEQHEKAVEAYKIYRESVVPKVEVEKVVKPVEPKRKFKVGDKVRVLDVSFAMATSALDVGDITKVVGYKEDFREYELLAPKERPVVVAEPEGETGLFEESALEFVEEKTPNELRAEVIQRAKEFVEKYRNVMLVKLKSKNRMVNINYVVNAKKRAVVVLLKCVLDDKVIAKGIAKCHPDGVFNEHIGKAIALGRALGKDVSEFYNAVQPNEPVVGHAVKGNEVLGLYRRDRKFTLTSEQGCDSFYYAEGKEYSGNPNDFIYNWQIGAIINDTNAQYKN